MRLAKMHADESDIDVDLVRRLLAEQFPRWADLPIEPVASSGTVNSLYRLGSRMAVRLPRVGSGAEDAEREHRWLPKLAPLLPVTIPVPLGRGTPSLGYPGHWSVYRWLEGETPTPEQVTDKLATDLAAFVSAVRRIGLDGGPAAYRGGPLTTLDASTRSSIEELHGMVDTEAVTAAWDAALNTPPWPGPPVWLHADLMPGNLLTVDGRLSAVIDFATAGMGDPACDLIIAWNLLAPDTRKVFREGLQFDDATWARGRGRALSQAVIALPYYVDTNPAMAATARYVIEQVLADHQS